MRIETNDVSARISDYKYSSSPVILINQFLVWLLTFNFERISKCEKLQTHLRVHYRSVVFVCIPLGFVALFCAKSDCFLAGPSFVCCSMFTYVAFQVHTPNHYRTLSVVYVSELSSRCGS